MKSAEITVPAKLTKADVEALYEEKVGLEAYTNPKPDPEVWPPVGWVEHPASPGNYYRMLSEADLREELFGSPEKSDWLKQAKTRIREIEAALISYFFGKADKEGVNRKEKAGFAAKIDVSIDRKFDLAALEAVVKECQEISDKKKLGIHVESSVIKWVPALKLPEWRKLPKEIQDPFGAALIVTPKTPTLEIVRIPSED